MAKFRPGFLQKKDQSHLQEFKDGIVNGMEADEVIKISRKNKIRFVRKPEKVRGDGKNSYIVNWFYPGTILTLKRVDRPGPYRVVKIEHGEILQS